MYERAPDEYEHEKERLRDEKVLESNVRRRWRNECKLRARRLHGDDIAADSAGAHKHPYTSEDSPSVNMSSSSRLRCIAT